MDSNDWSRPKKRPQALVAFSISTCLHLAACVTLALILIGSKTNGRSTLNFAMSTEDADEALTTFEVSAPIDETSEEPAEPNTVIELPTLELDSSLDEPTEVMPGTTAQGPSASVTLASSLAGAAGIELPKNYRSKASFFGAEAYGNRFVFVIDSSGSMRGIRWQSLCFELERAIKSLSPDQEFFIISFDSMAHPMFGKAPPLGKFLNPTPKNVTRARNWLRSIEHGHQTLPASAVLVAMKLKPDAIFLLSDGEINDTTVSDLRIWNHKIDLQEEEEDIKTLIPIHTVLLHSAIGYATLERIASENSGTFTPVQPR